MLSRDGTGRHSPGPRNCLVHIHDATSHHVSCLADSSAAVLTPLVRGGPAATKVAWLITFEAHVFTPLKYSYGHVALFTSYNSPLPISSLVM